MENDMLKYIIITELIITVLAIIIFLSIFKEKIRVSVKYRRIRSTLLEYYYTSSIILALMAVLVIATNLINLFIWK